MFLLAGEPGIGKTRLLKEAKAFAPRAGLNVLAGGCRRQGDQMPYAPLLDALQTYLGAQSAGHLRTELRDCAWLVRLLPELAAARSSDCPVDVHARPGAPLDEAAVARYLANIAGPAGTVLVLDDLQWTGQDALDLLATWCAPGDPLRIVGAYRDTEVRADESFGVMLADLAEAGLATQRRLGPLAPEEATDLLSRLLSHGQPGLPMDDETRERLLSRSDGVPFFLVSCAQAMQDGALDDGVPWSVAQGVRQRVAALPIPAQETLRAACVMGRSVPESLLGG